MNEKLIKQIIDATLYEGYMLYPYRTSAIKNQQRFNFGVVVPRAFAEADGSEKWWVQTECLARQDGDMRFNVRVRFLHLMRIEVRSDAANDRPIDNERAWEEVIEREIEIAEVSLTELADRPARTEFSFDGSETSEVLRNEEGEALGKASKAQSAISGELEIRAKQISTDTFRLSIRVSNTTPWPEARESVRNTALRRSLISAHTLLNVRRNGEFISLLDPPDEFSAHAAECQNIGTYPVLVGEEGERDCILSSPIILYDYPKIAPESPGDLFDGTEIDEILSLRILTMTDEEKLEARSADARTREMLDRTENLPAEHLMKLHGAIRGLRRDR